MSKNAQNINKTSTNTEESKPQETATKSKKKRTCVACGGKLDSNSTSCPYCGTEQ